MKIKRTRLPVDAFYEQFHNQDQPHFHSMNHPTKEWWQTHKDLPEHEMGPPVNYRRGGTVEPHVHPAYHIHGTHIREEIHGKPVFTGEL